MKLLFNTLPGHTNINDNRDLDESNSAFTDKGGDVLLPSLDVETNNHTAFSQEGDLEAALIFRRL